MIITEEQYKKLTFDEILNLINQFNNEVYNKFFVTANHLSILDKEGNIAYTYPYDIKDIKSFLLRNELMTLEEEISECKAGRLPWNYDEETKEWIY